MEIKQVSVKYVLINIVAFHAEQQTQIIVITIYDFSYILKTNASSNFLRL